METCTRRSADVAEQDEHDAATVLMDWRSEATSTVYGLRRNGDMKLVRSVEDVYCNGL